MARPMKRAQEGILQFYGKEMREKILEKVKNSLRIHQKDV